MRLFARDIECETARSGVEAIHAAAAIESGNGECAAGKVEVSTARDGHNARRRNALIHAGRHHEISTRAYRGRSRVGLRIGEAKDESILHKPTRPTDDASVVKVIAAFERHGSVVHDIPSDIAGWAAVAELERAAVHGRPARVGAVGGERQFSVARFGERAGAGDSVHHCGGKHDVVAIRIERRIHAIADSEVAIHRNVHRVSGIPLQRGSAGEIGEVVAGFVAGRKSAVARAA